MTKVYDHAVIYNGTFYPANTPIEEKVEIPVVKSSEGGSDKKPTKKGGGKNDSRAN